MWEYKYDSLLFKCITFFGYFFQHFIYKENFMKTDAVIIKIRNSFYFVKDICMRI